MESAERRLIELEVLVKAADACGMTVGELRAKMHTERNLAQRRHTKPLLQRGNNRPKLKCKNKKPVQPTQKVEVQKKGTIGSGKQQKFTEAELLAGKKVWLGIEELALLAGVCYAKVLEQYHEGNMPAVVRETPYKWARTTILPWLFITGPFAHTNISEQVLRCALSVTENKLKKLIKKGSIPSPDSAGLWCTKELAKCATAQPVIPSQQLFYAAPKEVHNSRARYAATHYDTIELSKMFGRTSMDTLIEDGIVPPPDLLCGGLKTRMWDKKKFRKWLKEGMASVNNTKGERTWA